MLFGEGFNPSGIEYKEKGSKLWKQILVFFWYFQEDISQ